MSSIYCLQKKKKNGIILDFVLQLKRAPPASPWLFSSVCRCCPGYPLNVPQKLQNKVYLKLQQKQLLFLDFHFQHKVMFGAQAIKASDGLEIKR